MGKNFITLRDLCHQILWEVVEILKRDQRFVDLPESQGDIEAYLKSGDLEEIFFEYFLLYSDDFVKRFICNFVVFPPESEGEEAHDKVSHDMREFAEEVIKEINYQIVAKEGGGEGGSQKCESIISLREKYYRVNYTYMSYQGYDISMDVPAFEVAPRKVEVIQFFDVE